jgi:pyruvate-formate lyase-activating enzyme
MAITQWHSKYNSFNGDKGLTYYEHYKAIMEWMNGKTGYLPPPIEGAIDPYAECNLRCEFCVGQRYLREHREEVSMRILPTKYTLKLINFMRDWGVHGVCFSGGGEPTLHPDFDKMIDCTTEGMEAAFASNMVRISPKLSESIMKCRWVGMSIDAASQQTYMDIKGADRFDDVIENVSYLTNLRRTTNSKVDLCYKMLMMPGNIGEIHTACKLAKELGVQDFFVRPVDFEREDIVGHKPLMFDLQKVEEQFDLCHQEETVDFHVYTVIQKFDENFHNKLTFKRCLATPILLDVLTDGNAYVCVDKKMQPGYKLASCYPDPEVILKWWGSDYHRDLLKSIVPEIECSRMRCTWQLYNQQIENTVLEDKMCLSFP